MPFGKGGGDIKTLRERKTELKKMEILQKAAGIFRKKGFYSTSMDDIANQLMMTKGSLYYYFNNKEEILYSCHDYSMNLVLIYLREIQASQDPPEVMLRKLLVRHMHMLMTEPTALLVATELEPLKGKYLQGIMEQRRTFEMGLREILGDGIAKGIFHAGDPKILAFVILGAVNWIPQWYSPRGEMGVDQIANVVAELLLRAVLKQEVQETSVAECFDQFSYDVQEHLRIGLLKLRSSIGLGLQKSAGSRRIGKKTSKKA